jgi:methylthioribose-1-phosphate isomerase
VTHVGSSQVAATGALIWNPSFDVTPHAFIDGIITERGIFRAPYMESLKSAFEEKTLA